MSITAYCGIEFDRFIQRNYSCNSQPTVRQVNNAIIFPTIGDWPTNLRGGVYDADLNFISGHKHIKHLDRGWGHICPLYDDEKKNR